MVPPSAKRWVDKFGIIEIIECAVAQADFGLGMRCREVSLRGFFFAHFRKTTIAEAAV
jgi:hypothetical protein